MARRNGVGLAANRLWLFWVDNLEDSQARTPGQRSPKAVSDGKQLVTDRDHAPVSLSGENLARISAIRCKKHT